MEREEAEKIYPWLGDLEGTLSSPEGTKALASYLIHFDSLPLLEFIWACDEMKNLVEETPSKADDLVSCIYKNYIISGSLPILSNQVVVNIAKQFEAHFERPEPSDFLSTPEKVQPVPFNLLIFDAAKTEVEKYLEAQIFPRFQNAIQNGEICVSIGSVAGVGGERNGCQAGGSFNGSSYRLASHPEAFSRTLCEKLEGLMKSRQNKPS